MENLEYKTVGKTIFMKRMDLKLSQEKFARLFDVSTNTIRNWEHGVSEPGASVFIKLQNLKAEV